MRWFGLAGFLYIPLMLLSHDRDRRIISKAMLGLSHRTILLCLESATVALTLSLILICFWQIIRCFLVKDFSFIAINVFGFLAGVSVFCLWVGQ